MFVTGACSQLYAAVLNFVLCSDTFFYGWRDQKEKMVPTTVFSVVLALSVALTVTRTDYDTTHVSKLWLPLTQNGTCAPPERGILRNQWVECVASCTDETITVGWYCFDETVPWPRDLTGAHWDTDATVVPLFEAMLSAGVAGVLSSTLFAVAMRCGGILIFGVAYGTVFGMGRLSYELWTHENSEVHSFGWLTGLVAAVAFIALLSASSALLAVVRITQDAAKVVSCRWTLVCGSGVATLLQCIALGTGSWLVALALSPCLRVTPAPFSLFYRHVHLVDYDKCAEETALIVLAWFWVVTFVRHSWQVAIALFAVGVIRHTEQSEQSTATIAIPAERTSTDGATDALPSAEASTNDVQTTSASETESRIGHMPSSELSTSGTTSDKSDEKSDKPYGVFSCWCHAVALHHGTIALGSFVTTVTWAVFLCVRYVRRHTETLRRHGSGTEALHRSLLCVARCCSGLCVVLTDMTLRRVYAAVAVSGDSVSSGIRRLRAAMAQHPLVYALVTASTAFVDTLHVCVCAVGGGYTVVQMGVTAPLFVLLGGTVAVMTGRTVGSPLRMVIEVTTLLRTDTYDRAP